MLNNDYGRKLLISYSQGNVNTDKLRIINFELKVY